MPQRLPERSLLIALVLPDSFEPLSLQCISGGALPDEPRYHILPPDGKGSHTIIFLAQAAVVTVVIRIIGRPFLIGLLSAKAYSSFPGIPFLFPLPILASQMFANLGLSDTIRLHQLPRPRTIQRRRAQTQTHAQTCTV